MSIEKYATKKDIKIESSSLSAWTTNWLKFNLIISENAIAPIVVIASKKLNLAAASLLIPKKSAAEMVIPDLEVPGIKAKHCETPITRDWMRDIEFKLLDLEFALSATYNTTPKIIVA